MSDEIKEVEEQLKLEGINNEPEITREEKTSQEEKVLTAFEQEQMEKGWNPEGTKSAEEWARAEPLFSEIKLRGKEIKQLKRTIDELKEHMNKQKELAYKQALADLQTQRNAAIARGDADLVNRIDEETANMAPPSQPKSEAVLDFEERHASWLHGVSYEDMEMQKFAFERDNQLASRNLSPEEHMKVLEEHIMKKFPEYFGNIRETVSRMSSVESGYENNAPATKKRKYEFKDLNAEQKQIARDFDKLGVMKIEEYIKQLADNGDIK